MIRRANPRIFMGLTAAMLLIGGGGVYFAWGDVSDMQDKLASLKQEVRTPTDVQKDLDDSTKKLQDCQALLTHLEQGVPDHAYLPTMLSELEKVGKDNGIQVTGVKPIMRPAPVKKEGEKAQKKAYEELDIEVRGRGKFEDVRKFIAAMNVFPKVVAARTVGLVPKTASGQEWSDDLDITVELRAFVFPTKDGDPGQEAKAEGDALAEKTPELKGAAEGTPVSKDRDPFGAKSAPAKGGTAKAEPAKPALTVDATKKPVKEVQTHGR